MRFRASDAADAIGGRLIGPDVDLDGAAFDSRLVRPGELFVALVADRDGHDFADAAVAAGSPAVLALPGRIPPSFGATLVEVVDTAAALLDLARWARTRFDPAVHVVGVTGSVGKTTTKDLVAAATGASMTTASSHRSYNNDQGLPVTVLGAAVDTEVLVLEMGMRGFGEIQRLCDVARPTVGVVTSVGHSHTERVGGIDGVARAKAELVRALPSDGIAVLNADDARVAAMRAGAPGGVVTYGSDRDADVRIVQLELDDLARPRFGLATPWGWVDVALAASGVHMASNAAAALAVAGVVGAELDAAADALGRVEMAAMRMETGRTPTGALVVNDAYNANPTSMAAALESVAAMRASRRIAVLGPMAELDDLGAGHREVAELVMALGIELVAVGTDRYGAAPVDDPVAAIGPLTADDIVLVKASRMAALDRVAARLLAG
ncbi:MAG: UDP-N-acetylmuramoyl-tripeptide--D-alanyl-D-alanine ligase [Ilumatobacteraceae bacterium]